MEIRSLQEVMQTSNPSEAFSEAYHWWAKENPEMFSELINVTENWMSHINDSRVKVSDRDLLHIAYDRMWISFYSYYEDIHKKSEELADQIMREPYIDLNMYRFCLYCMNAYIDGDKKHATNMARCAYVRVRNHFGEMDINYLPILADWLPEL